MTDNTEVKTSKNKKLIVLAIIGVALILAITVGVLGKVGSKSNRVKLRALKGSPQEIVIAALYNTEDKIKSETDLLNEKNGTAVLNKIFESEATQLDFNMIFKDIEGIDDADLMSAYLRDAGLTGNVTYTKDGNKFNVTLGAKQGDLDLLGFTLYKDGEELGLDIPKLFDNPYAVKLDTLYEDFENSTLFSLMGFSSLDPSQMEEVSTIFDALKDYFNGLVTLEDNEEYITKSKDIVETFIKSLDFQKDYKTSEGYIAYTADITLEQIKDLCIEQMEMLLELDFVRNYFTILGADMGMDADDLLDEMRENFEYMDEEDLEISVELCVDDHFIRSGVVSITDTIYEETIEISLSFSDTEYLTNNVVIDLGTKESSDYDNGLYITLGNNLGEKTDVLEQDFTFGVLDYGDLTELNFESMYDVKAKEDNLEVLASIVMPYDGTINIKGTGTKTVDKSAKKVSMQLEEFTISAEEEELGIDMLLGYGAQAIKAKDVKINTTKPAEYILEMTTAELMSMVEIIESNLQAFSYGIF